jgi:hypothetical protein
MYILNLFIRNDYTTTTFYNDYYDHSKPVVKDLNSNNLTKMIIKNQKCKLIKNVKVYKRWQDSKEVLKWIINSMT